MPPLRRASALLMLSIAAGGCAGGGSQASPEPAAAPVPNRPLAGLVAQRIVVAPVAAVTEGDPLGWAAAIPRQREWRQTLDREISTELGLRGLDRAWVFPEALGRAYDRNPAMSPDPYRLATEPIRGVTKPNPEVRIPDPLASQLRTLVAVHDARFVLVPVQAAFERAGDEGGRAVLRLVLVDARAAEVRWAGEVRSSVFATFNPEVTVSLADSLADLIAAP